MPCVSPLPPALAGRPPRPRPSPLVVVGNRAVDRELAHSPQLGSAGMLLRHHTMLTMHIVMVG